VTERTGVAERLYDLLVQLFGVAPPVRVVAWDGSQAGADEGPTVRINTRRAIRRLLWAPGELGLARAYVAGDVDIDGDLVAALRDLAEYGSMIGPKPVLSAADRREVLRTAVLLGAVGPAPRPPVEEFAATGERSPTGRERIAATVRDRAGLELFCDILGSSLTYSCAQFEHPSQPLAQAQTAKLDLVCRSLELRPGMRLLDVGSGFGSLLAHAAEHYGVSAVGMVRSADAAELARRRIAEAGLGDRVDVRLGDFTGVVDAPYDAVAALETAEFLPAAGLGGFASTLHGLLRPGGRLFLQQVTGLAGSGDASTAMSSYLYPAGPLVSVGSVVTAVDDARLEVRTVSSRREHYPPTLRAWLDHLQAHWDEAVRVVGEPRARQWRLSLALSIVGFERGRISVHQVVAVRPYADGRTDPPSPDL